jgi:hypothetical protein
MALHNDEHAQGELEAALNLGRSLRCPVCPLATVCPGCYASVIKAPRLRKVPKEVIK